MDRNLQIIALLDALIELAQVAKILDSFYVSFEEKTIDKGDGRHYLFGSLKLGGTISGRLSSNLQQLPSTGTKYAKPTKQCFQAPDGWLLVGIDYSSLEDRISALLTKDPNKLKVYTGHILYDLTVNGVCHRILDDTIIRYDGKEYTGEQFYAKYGSSQTS